MIVRAIAKHIKISPSKVREVINVVRGKDVLTADGLLLNINKGAVRHIRKTLKSAVSNAQVKGFKPEQLYISKISADVGPMWKRFKAAAFGRAAKIRRRTAHITVELDLKG